MRAALASTVVLVPLATAGWGSHHAVGLRIFDPSHRATREVTQSDVVRGSVHVDVSTTGRPVVTVGLTQHGTAALCALTRAVALRGSALGHVQRLAIAVDGRVYARPWIDYRANPRGLCGSPSLEIDVASSTVARKIARELG